MSYEFLIEMAWKSAAIAGLALALAALLRSRAAADRGAVLKVAVAMLIALPAILLFAPALEVATPAAGTAAAAIPLPVPAIAEAATLPAGPSTRAAATPEGDWNDPSLLFFLLYAGGAAMVGGRLLAGLWILRRWTRAARPVDAPQWRAALDRAGGGGLGIRLLVSEDAASPLSWGWRHPVILIDRDTLRAPGEADAILAHEVAHVARRDWPALILSRTAVALFWFNPLVWRLDREVAHQAEEAADSAAAARIEPALYAQTLLDWARLSGGDSGLPANAIAGDEPGLSRRVKAILDGRAGRRSGSLFAIAAVAGCAALAAPVAALEFVPEAPAAPEAPRAPLAPASATAPLAPAAPPAVPAAMAPLAPHARSAAAAPPAPFAAPTPPAKLALLADAPPPPAPPRSPYDVDEAGLVDGDAIAAEVEASVAAAMRSAEAAVSRASAAADAAAEGMARGAEGMVRGADGMERGAARMQAEARRLRSDADYRRQKIREAEARGRHLTDAEMLRAADGMDKGADGMREGARAMRRSAEDMRRRHP